MPITTFDGKALVFNNGVVDVQQNGVSVVDENKIAHITAESGGSGLNSEGVKDLVLREYGMGIKSTTYNINGDHVLLPPSEWLINDIHAYPNSLTYFVESFDDLTSGNVIYVNSELNFVFAGAGSGMDHEMGFDYDPGTITIGGVEYTVPTLEIHCTLNSDETEILTEDIVFRNYTEYEKTGNVHLKETYKLDPKFYINTVPEEPLIIHCNAVADAPSQREVSINGDWYTYLNNWTQSTTKPAYLNIYNWQHTLNSPISYFYLASIAKRGNGDTDPMDGTIEYDNSFIIGSDQIFDPWVLVHLANDEVVFDRFGSRI